MGQPLGLLGHALGREPREGLGNAGVQDAPPLVEQPPIRDFVGERVLEGELEVRKEPDLVKELRGLEMRQRGPHRGLRRVGGGLEQRQGHVLADDGGGLEQALGLGRQAVDARHQDGLHGGGDCQLFDGPGEAIGSALAGQGRRLYQRPHALLEEEGIRLRPFNQELLERAEGRVSAEERTEQLVSALGRQGIDPELAVVGLAAPGVAVLGTVIDEVQEARGGQAVDEAIEQGLGLGVEPVQILADQQQRLHLAFAQQQALERRECALATLCRIELAEWAGIGQHVKERAEHRQGVLEGLIKRQDLARDLGTDGARVVSVLNVGIALEQVNDREVRRGSAVGHRGTFQDTPALSGITVDTLVHQTRLAHPGLAEQGHELALSLTGLRERLCQRRQFLVTPDKARQPARHGGLQVAMDGAWHPPTRRRPWARPAP